jgi:hypothetical protein
MGWAVWLLIPVVLTVVAALASWLRARPARTPNTQQAMQAHGEFLEALTRPAESKDTSPLPSADDRPAP